MKKSILFILMAYIFFNNTYSQIRKGNWLMGGDANFISTYYTSTVASTSNQILIQLLGDIGYFIANKFTIGLKPGFESSTVKFFTGSNTVNTFGLGPFVRYYLLPNEKQVNILSEVSYQYGLIHTNSPSENLHTNKFLFSSGVAVFLNTSTALEFTIGYSTLNYTNSSGRNNAVVAGIGFQFHLEKN